MRDNRTKRLRKLELEARLLALEEMEDHIGGDPMGDFIHFGGDAMWLCEEDAFSVLDLLRKKTEERIEKL